MTSAEGGGQQINLATLWIPIVPETSRMNEAMRRAGEEGKREFMYGFGSGEEFGAALASGIGRGFNNSNIGEIFRPAMNLISGQQSLMIGAVAGATTAGLELVAKGVESVVEVVAKGLETVADEVIKSGDVFDALNRQMVLYSSAQGDQLEELRKTATDVFARLDTDGAGLGKTLGILSQQFHMTQSELQETAYHVTELSERFGQLNVETLSAAMHQFGLDGADVDRALATLTGDARDAGISLNGLTQAMVTSGPTLTDLGINFNSAAEAMSKINQLGDPAQRVVVGLAHAAAQMGKGSDADSLRTFLLEITKQFDYLQSIGDKGGMEALGNELFGARNYEIVLQTLHMIRDAMNGIGAQGNPIDLNNMIDQSRILEENWRRIKNELSTALSPVGVTLFESLNQGLDHVKDWFDQNHNDIIQKIQGWGDEFIAMLPKIQEWAVVGGRLFVDFGAAAAVALGPMAENFAIVGAAALALTGNVKEAMDLLKAPIQLGAAAIKGASTANDMLDKLEQMDLHSGNIADNFDRAMDAMRGIHDSPALDPNSGQAYSNPLPPGVPGSPGMPLPPAPGAPPRPGQPGFIGPVAPRRGEPGSPEAPLQAGGLPDLLGGGDLPQAPPAPPPPPPGNYYQQQYQGAAPQQTPPAGSGQPGETPDQTYARIFGHPAPAGNTGGPTQANTSGYTSPSGTNWDAVAQGESSGDWHINTGNGYYGGLQFKQSTWEEFGGLQFAPRADLASPEQQKMIADKVLAAQGPGAWPNTYSRGAPGTGAATQATTVDYHTGTGGYGGYGGGGYGSDPYANIPVATGGAASDVDAFAASVSGQPYGYGGYGDAAHGGLYDCSGFMSALYGVMTGKALPGQARFFSTTSDFASLGFIPEDRPHPGNFEIGVNPQPGMSGHMAGTLPSGVNVESGGAADKTQYGGQAAGAWNPEFSQHYYLPTGSSGGPIDATMVDSHSGPSGPSPGDSRRDRRDPHGTGLTPNKIDEKELQRQRALENAHDAIEDARVGLEEATQRARDAKENYDNAQKAYDLKFPPGSPESDPVALAALNRLRLAKESADIAVTRQEQAGRRAGEDLQMAEMKSDDPLTGGSGSSRGATGYGAAQALGQGLLSGVASDLGLGNIFGGKPPTEWGITKLLGGIAGWGIGTLNAFGDAMYGKGDTGAAAQANPLGQGLGHGLGSALGLGNVKGLPKIAGPANPAAAPPGASPNNYGPPPNGLTQDQWNAINNQANGAPATAPPGAAVRPAPGAPWPGSSDLHDPAAPAWTQPHVMHTGGWAQDGPAVLKGGEFVVKDTAASMYGPMLEGINSYDVGGPVKPGAPGFIGPVSASERQRQIDADARRVYMGGAGTAGDPRLGLNRPQNFQGGAWDAVNQGSLGVIPNVPKDYHTFTHWDQATSGERWDAGLDAASFIPIPGLGLLERGATAGIRGIGRVAKDAFGGIRGMEHGRGIGTDAWAALGEHAPMTPRDDAALRAAGRAARDHFDLGVTLKDAGDLWTPHPGAAPIPKPGDHALPGSSPVGDQAFDMQGLLAPPLFSPDESARLAAAFPGTVEKSAGFRFNQQLGELFTDQHGFVAARDYIQRAAVNAIRNPGLVDQTFDASRMATLMGVLSKDARKFRNDPKFMEDLLEDPDIQRLFAAVGSEIAARSAWSAPTTETLFRGTKTPTNPMHPRYQEYKEGMELNLGPRSFAKSWQTAHGAATWPASWQQNSELLESGEWNPTIFRLQPGAQVADLGWDKSLSPGGMDWSGKLGQYGKPESMWDELFAMGKFQIERIAEQADINSPGSLRNVYLRQMNIAPDVPGYATGGEVVAKLHEGEHVFTVDDVKAAGGQEGVYAIRQALHSGGFDTGGPVPVSASSNVRTGGGLTGSYMGNKSLEHLGSALGAFAMGNSDAQHAYAQPGNVTYDMSINMHNTTAADPSALKQSIQEMQMQRFYSASSGLPAPTSY